MDLNLKSEIANAALPIEKATGMPNWFYTSPDAIAVMDAMAKSVSFIMPAATVA